MSKQRFFAAGAATVALAGLGGTAFALQGQSQVRSQGPDGGRGRRVPPPPPSVRPYEPVETGRDALLGLRGAGRL
ncbi:hypothetical protein ACGRHY_12225 [Streptomyces sp. HK10]|uniref:hypothetical protein n=1 Tax=Streptomyces sp. HK10 TaxID=3373255 RepID=UPI0037499674